MQSVFRSFSGARGTNSTPGVAQANLSHIPFNVGLVINSTERAGMGTGQSKISACTYRRPEAAFGEESEDSPDVNTGPETNTNASRDTSILFLPGLFFQPNVHLKNTPL